MATFIVNGNGYFFIVEDDVELNADEIADCEIYPSAEEMYEASCDITGQDLDEIEGMDTVIKYRDGVLVSVDARGVVDYIEGSAGEYIDSYEI